MKINAALIEGLPYSGENKPIAKIFQTARILKDSKIKKCIADQGRMRSKFCRERMNQIGGDLSMNQHENLKIS